jgi:hypothetical protein
MSANHQNPPNPYSDMRYNRSPPMTDDIPHPDDAKERSDDQQHAVEACQHAVDALSNGDLSRGRSLLDEAHEAVERVEHDTLATQEQCEIAFDCYD